MSCMYILVYALTCTPSTLHTPHPPPHPPVLTLQIPAAPGDTCILHVMPAKKVKLQYDAEHTPQLQPPEHHTYLEQLPLEVLHQVADCCAGPSTQAAAVWAPVCRTWQTASTAIKGRTLSFVCGKHLTPALYVDNHKVRDLYTYGLPATHHLPITAVLWASHRDVTRVTSLGAWLRHNAARIPELEVQAVNDGSAELALSVRVYRQLRLDWADAHAALFDGLGAAAPAPAAAEGQASSSSAAAAVVGGPTGIGGPHLTRLQLPGLGHVPAPTLAAGLAACPALESLSLPFTWPQWIKARTSPQASPLYEALRGLTRLSCAAVTCCQPAVSRCCGCPTSGAWWRLVPHWQRQGLWQPWWSRSSCGSWR
jgi:hypothetical protein